MIRQRMFFGIAAIATLMLFMVIGRPVSATTSVFINEIHYDNDFGDVGEAIEIAGPAGLDLTGWSLVLYNGSNGASYNTLLLSSIGPDLGGGFGVWTISLPTNGIQNGAPDGIALVDAGSSVVQFLSYEGSFTATDGPANGMSSTDIGVSEPGSTTVGHSLQLTGSGSEYSHFIWATAQPNTFGAVNTGQTFGGTPPTPSPTPEPSPTPDSAPELVINEIDYDQPGGDTAEFLEIKNVGSGSTNLNGVTVELVNGSNDTIYDTIALPAVTLTAGDYFVVCSDTSTVTNCDLEDIGSIQNGGPDAVGLRHSGVLLDAVSYEGSAGAPYTEGSGAGLFDSGSSSQSNRGISRCTDGADTDQNNIDLVNTTITPGGTNSCPGGPATHVIINEVDADQSGTDAAEFMELYDGGEGDTALSGLVVVFYNGSDDKSTGSAYDLDGQTTDSDGYFVLCGNAANVANCDLDVSPSSNLIQNGADAVALHVGDATSYPNDTPVSTTNLLDAIVYDTNDSDDAGLLVLLNPGQPQVDERGNGDGTGHSNQRCPDGSGGARNTSTYDQWAPTPGEENVCEIVVAPLSCTDESVITLIHDVQGGGATSPLENTTVVIDGVVVGDFQNNAQSDSGDLNGFYVQEEDLEIDANPATSEGIFVHAAAADVAVGDHVRVRGDVAEFSTSGGASLMTELKNVTVAVCTDSVLSPTPATVILPVTAVTDLEAYEGMLVQFTQSLAISEYFNFDRFGDIVLSTDRQFQPTAIFEPGSLAAADLADLNTRSRITLDDGRTSQNPDPSLHPNGSEFLLTNRFRGGDLVTGVIGVIDETFGLYRIQPTQAGSYTAVNSRPVAPDPVGGRITVASFNVLNYFTTLDDSGSICGPSMNLGCRGADNAGEFTRQRDKIIAALATIDADIVGLVELENNADVALADLVNGLNAATAPGTYAYVATGYIGTDAITVALIYKPATVSPDGLFAVLDDPSFTQPNTSTPKNRPALAQTFMENSSGAKVTVVVNHLKSKGSGCGVDDDDAEQGSCNLTRTMAAQVLVDWLATDPTGSGDPDFLITGDLNAYDKEDPIDVFTGNGYVDLEAVYGGEFSYSFVFSGQLGYLDYALANASLTTQVTGAGVWHINADEPDILDYDTSFKKAAQDALYEPNAYRASDHDPVIVGLELNGPPVCSAAIASRATLWPPNHKMKAIDIQGVTDPDGDPFAIVIDSIYQDELVNGGGDGDTAPDGDGVGTTTALVRAERAGDGNGRFYHISFTATDSSGNSCSDVVQVSVPTSRGKKGLAIDDGPLYDSTIVGP